MWLGVVVRSSSADWTTLRPLGGEREGLAAGSAVLAVAGRCSEWRRCRRRAAAPDAADDAAEDEDARRRRPSSGRARGRRRRRRAELLEELELELAGWPSTDDHHERPRTPRPGAAVSAAPPARPARRGAAAPDADPADAGRRSGEPPRRPGVEVGGEGRPRPRAIVGEQQRQLGELGVARIDRLAGQRGVDGVQAGGDLGIDRRFVKIVSLQAFLSFSITR